MAPKITHDAHAPTAAVELIITQPMPDYDLEKFEVQVPREVDPLLASQGFKDLIDDARAVLDRALDGTGLEIAQLTGAICHAGEVYRPGLWLVLRETGAAPGQPMSDGARVRVAAVAEHLRTRLGLS